jgi:hypothetical protein
MRFVIKEEFSFGLKRIVSYFSERRRALSLCVGSSEIDSRFERQRGSLLDYQDARGRRGPNVHCKVRLG